jgi:hypothetical protein
MCSIRLSVARSCDPPAAECPVAATGSSPNTAAATSSTVVPQVSVMRQPANTSTATTAVTSQAVADSSRGTTAMSCPKPSTAVSGRPSVSATLNGIISSAATVQVAAAAAPARSAR